MRVLRDRVFPELVASTGGAEFRGARHTRATALRSTVLLWSRDGRDAQLHDYEDAVLPLLIEHRGALIARERVARGSTDEPTEIQIIELADQDAFDSYMRDPRRIALKDKRADAIERTQVLHSAPPVLR